jgi:dihydrodipicolinate synthase/N-acetylneuraminate lyase
MQEDKSKDLSGAVPIIAIPFDADENIDEEGLRRLVEFAANKGFGGICLPAYGGEFYKLSDEERVFVVKVAVNQAAGRLRVIAQSNHGSSRVALAMARKHVENGADLISIALPRSFVLSDDDLLRFLKPILNGVDVPSLVQDYYPGGTTIGANFVARLSAECPGFRYLKFEEPQVMKKLVAIREVSKDRIKVLDGTGGLYQMELIPTGLAGVMSGLALADALNVVFRLRAANRSEEAFQLYEKFLPFLVFGLQNFELWLYCEKRLLQARGLLTSARCRDACIAPDPNTVRYVDEMNERIMQALENAGLSAKS